MNRSPARDVAYLNCIPICNSVRSRKGKIFCCVRPGPYIRKVDNVFVKTGMAIKNHD